MKKFCHFLVLIFCLTICMPSEAKKDSARFHNELGFKHQQAGEYEKALEHYLVAVEKKPTFFAAQNNVGTVYYILRKYKDSIHYYNKAIKLKPDSFVAHYSKGVAILAILNNHKFKKKPKPKLASLFELSAIKNENITLNDAIQELEIAEKLSKGNTKVRLALGIAYFQNEEKEKAFKKFKEVLKYEPHEPIANFYTGLTLHKKGNYNCISYYENALKSDPYYTKAYIQISKALLENHDHQKAYDYIEKGLDLFNCCSEENETNENVLISKIQQSERPIRYSKTSKSKGNTVYNSAQSQFNEEDKAKLVELSYLVRLF